MVESGKRTNIPCRIAIPVLVLLTLLGFSVLGLSAFNQVTFFNPDYAVLFSVELHTLVMLGFAAGGCALLSVIITAVFLSYKRWIGLGMILVFLSMLVCITMGTWGLIYGNDYYQQEASSSNIDIGIVKLAYNKDERVTFAWNEIEENFECSSQASMFFSGVRECYYHRSDCFKGPAVAVSRNITIPCVDSFIKYRFFDMFSAAKACENLCEYKVPEKIKNYIIPLACQSVSCACLQFISILLMLAQLLSQAACCSKGLNTSGVAGSCTRQLKMNCVCGEKTCNWTFGCLPANPNKEATTSGHEKPEAVRSVEYGSDVPLLTDE